MAGDRNFGPNGCSGSITGAAAAVPIQLDFAPQTIKVYNITQGGLAIWVKGMANDSAFSPGGGDDGGISRITETGLTVTGDTTTLQHKPFIVSSIYGTAGTSPGVKKLTPDGRAPSPTGEAGISGTTLTFATIDGITAAQITYIYEGGGGGGGGGSLTTPNAINVGNGGFSIGTALMAVDDVIYWEASR
jgi:hypothetical protein